MQAAGVEITLLVLLRGRPYMPPNQNVTWDVLPRSMVAQRYGGNQLLSNWIWGLFHRRELFLALWTKPKTREVICLSGEPTISALLNGYAVKQPPKFMFLPIG